MANDLPLPVDLPRDLVRKADHLWYLYYVDTPHRVNPTDGALVEADAKSKGDWLLGSQRGRGDSVLTRCNAALRQMGPLLDAVLARQRAAADAASPNSLCVDYTTASRLQVGTGYKNSIEIGLGLHPTYGVPYLPGPSVKGLVRAWFETYGEADAATVQRLFGSATKDEHAEEHHQVGALTFFDAFPRSGVVLEPDVLTPHFGPYYGSPTEEPPAVWHDPNPVAFLAVAAGTAFRFVVTARAGGPFAQPGDLDATADALAQALAWLGAGAKTSNGYGRFDTPALRDLFSF